MFVFTAVGLHDGLSWEDITAFSVGAASVLGLMGLVYRMFLSKPFKEFREFTMWWRKFQRDWDGEPASPGRQAVPGVMERLNRIDGELSRNGGESMKDKVVETWERLDSLESRMSQIEEIITSPRQ